MDGRRFEELLRAQQNFVTRAQALDCGFTVRELRTKLARGDWREVGRGYYWVPSNALPHQELIYAAVNCGGSDVVASHRSAGHLQGIWGLARSQVLEVTIPHRAYHPVTLTHPISGVTKRIHVHSARDLPASDVIDVAGVRCTTRHRTLVNTAELYDAQAITRARLVAAFEYCVMKGDRYEILERLDELKVGRRGMAVLAALAGRRPMTDPAVQSPMEAIADDILWTLGLRPLRQHRVVVGGRQFFIDLAFPEFMLAIEFDGRRYHDDWDARQADMERDALLSESGWCVFRTTWRVIMNPARFAMKVVKLLLSRARHLGVTPPTFGIIHPAMFN